MANTIQDAYRIVLNDILNNGPEMFVGNYDAKNGSEEFMYGIGTVVEYIAHKISEEDGDAIEDLFIKNIVKSKQEVQSIKCYKCAELSGCYKGQHDGKKKCKCFSPISIDKEAEV